MTYDKEHDQIWELIISCEPGVSHLSNTFSFHFQCLHLREVVIVSDNVGDDWFFIRMVNADICIRQKYTRVVHKHKQIKASVNPKSQTSTKLSGKTAGHGFLISPIDRKNRKCSEVCCMKSAMWAFYIQNTVWCFLTLLPFVLCRLLTSYSSSWWDTTLS